MAMLGCVFTQHAEDEQGLPIRDHQSTTYLAAFESPGDFGIGLRREALRRGLATADQSVLLIGGAAGLERLGRDYFPDATQIVDFYHAMEHLQIPIEALMGEADVKRINRRRHHSGKILHADGPERIIAHARKEASKIDTIQEVESALGYFLRNLRRMRYGEFRSRGYLVGSGVVEAGCRSLIGKRCKQSGMLWTEQGATNVITLRCINASHRLDAFWQEHLNFKANLNTEPLKSAD
jgi:hypothetical protein